MLKYSELSKPQKKIVREMRQGHELTYKFSGDIFRVNNGRFSLKVDVRTVASLVKNYCIVECFRDKEKIIYCLNVDFLTSENLDAIDKDLKEEVQNNEHN